MLCAAGGRNEKRLECRIRCGRWHVPAEPECDSTARWWRAQVVVGTVEAGMELAGASVMAAADQVIARASITAVGT